VSESSDRGWTAPVSRRGILALPLVLAIGSCTQLSSINDQYINAMKKDPMFLWEPPMAAIRNVQYSPRDGTFERTTVSSIAIWLTPNDPEQVPALLRAAEEARTQAGYSDKDRRPGGKDSVGDYWIECDINANRYKPGTTPDPASTAFLTVQIQLTAPHLEP